VTDLTLQQLVLRLFAFIIIAGVHGAAVAAAACTLGDPGPRYDGRLRANPFTHIDLLGLLGGVLFLVGWSKPVTIDPAALRPGRLGLVVVVVAAAAATLGTVMALRLARPWLLLLPWLGDTSSTVVFSLIETIGELGVWFALVNLLPAPPFTGSHLLVALVPQIREPMRRSQVYAALLLLGIGATGVITGALAPADRVLMRVVMGE
jgi:Zn-dependent protease